MTTKKTVEKLLTDVIVCKDRSKSKKRKCKKRGKK